MHWYDNRFQGFVKYVEIDGTVKDRKRVNTFYGYFFFIINTLLELLLYHQYA